MKRFATVVLCSALALTLTQAASANNMASAGGSVSVSLHAQNGSNENGTATLTQHGADIVVTISATGGTVTPQPAHIHQGTCAKLNPAPKYPLSNVVNGKSTTTLKSMTLASLETGGFAINIHKSAADLPHYVSCGDIPKK
jgi:Cu/Zn superoxide dismutase